jgi:hypothetical protein
MCPVKDLSLGYHQQDNQFCCGAACAETLLISDGDTKGSLLGGALDPTDSTYQQTWSGSLSLGLWNNIDNCMDTLTSSGASVGVFRSSSGDYNGTHPDVLAKVLNEHKDDPKYANITFKVFASTNRDDITRRVAQTIINHNIAPLVLLWGGQHWVAVTGCNYVLKPPKLPPIWKFWEFWKFWEVWKSHEIEIKDFLIQDPFPPMNLASIGSVPHSIGDQCGDGYVASAALAGAFDARGFTRAHIPYNSWCCEYMADPIPVADPSATPPIPTTPAYSPLGTCTSPPPTGTLSGTFVAVCAVYTDNSDSGLMYTMTSSSPCPQSPTSASALDDPLPAGRREKIVQKVIKVASNYLNDPTYQLSTTRELWCDFIPGLSSAGSSGLNMAEVEAHTVFVNRFIPEAPDFYLVPIILNSTSMPALVRVAVIAEASEILATTVLNNPNDLTGFEAVDTVCVPVGFEAVEASALTSALVVHLYVTMPPLLDESFAESLLSPTGDLLNPDPTAIHLQNFPLKASATPVRLTWQACSQSFSPHLPFIEFDPAKIVQPPPELQGKRCYLRWDFQVSPTTHKVLGVMGITKPGTRLAGI